MFDEGEINDSWPCFCFYSFHRRVRQLYSSINPDKESCSHFADTELKEDMGKLTTSAGEYCLRHYNSVKHHSRHERGKGRSVESPTSNKRGKKTVQFQFYSASASLSSSSSSCVYVNKHVSIYVQAGLPMLCHTSERDHKVFGSQFCPSLISSEG